RQRGGDRAARRRPRRPRRGAGGHDARCLRRGRRLPRRAAGRCRPRPLRHRRRAPARPGRGLGRRGRPRRPARAARRRGVRRRARRGPALRQVHPARRPGGTAMTHRFSGHDPAAGTDTGGTPWQGRTLTGTGFDSDTGEADARLAELLAQEAPDPAELVAAVASVRLIVPIVAAPGEIDDSSGIPVDATSDMASVTLVAPDGQRALPVFTSAAALVAWDPTARPVPVTAQRAALA